MVNRRIPQKLFKRHTRSLTKGEKKQVSSAKEYQCRALMVCVIVEVITQSVRKDALRLVPILKVPYLTVFFQYS